MKSILSFFLFVLSTSYLFSQSCSTPVSQCYNVSISNLTTSSLKVSWTKGSGAYSLVVLKPAVNSTITPTNSGMPNYAPSTVYGSGTNLGSSNYVVYMGIGTSITVTGLSSCYNYDAIVYSYNSAYNSIIDDYVYCVKTTYGSNNTDEHYTLSTEPTGAPGLSVNGTPGITTATLSCTGGTGASWSLISVRPSTATAYAPTDANYYGASSSFGSGYEVGGTGTNNFSTYFSSATGTVNLTNLQPATGYYARVYSFNGSGTATNNCYNYYTGNYYQVYFNTYNNPPVMNAVNNYTICQDAPTQTITLSGIGDGSASENQSLSLYASSTNSTLIQNVTVNYTSPNTTGNIVFTPTTGQYGTSVIYLYLYDNGPGTNYSYKTFTVTVLPRPGAAGAIVTSNTVICQQKNGVIFTVPSITNATGYNWTLPSGATLTAGSNTNSITVNFNTSLTSGQVSVYGINTNGCGNGISSSKNIVFDLPPTAALAGSSQSICANTTQLAGNTPSVGAASWSLQAGSATISTPTLANSSITGIANNASVVAVWTVTNGVCPVSSSTVGITNIFGSPSCNPDADFVSNKTTVCVGSPVVFYNSSIGATSYTWNFGPTATPSVSSSSGSVSVIYSSVGAKTPTLSITTTASLTNTEIKSNYITVITSPTAPTSILGNNTVCQGKTSESYFVNTVADATDYIWSFPAGVYQNTGSTTNAITANFSVTASSGNIAVYAENSCGSSTVTTFSVSVNPLPSTPSSISGSVTVCQGANGISYIASGINNALSYTWSTPSGCNIVGGLNTPSVIVNYDNMATSGTVSVYGTNGCGNGNAGDLAITVNPLPGVATTVDGSVLNTMCPLSTNISYSTSPVANATTYSWVYPNGYTVVGASNTNTLVLDATLNALSGAIKVVGVNACGHGDTSSVLNVNIDPLPTQELCLVTVDSFSIHNEIVWQKVAAANIDSFRVYRVQTASIDTLIGTVSYNDLGRVVDINANPNVTSYTYKIAAVDTCGNEGPKSTSHQSIHLQSIYTPSPQKMDLMWNTYVGASVDNYRVLRDTGNSGNWVPLVTNLAPNATSFTDFGIPAGATSVQYRVDVIWTLSCNYAAKTAQSVINTTKSNTKDFVISSPGASIKEQESLLNSINLYPNPTKDKFDISIKAAVDNIEIRIMNQFGSLVKFEAMHYQDNATIDISEFASGIYFIQIKTAFGSVTKRLTKL